MATKSWEVSDEFWGRVSALIPKAKRDPEKSYQRRCGAGRKPMEPRKIFEAIVYVLRTGIQWKAPPKEYGNSSSIHRYFKRWEAGGITAASRISVRDAKKKIAIQNGCKAKRWIVEVAHSWFNRFRKLLVRYEKSNSSFEALLHFAATIIIYRKLTVI